MSELKSSQIDHNGEPLSEVLELVATAAEAEYNHPPTHDVTMITGAASTVYVDQKIADLVESSPATLDTLNELASALGDDPNFATTVSTAIGTRTQSKILSGTFLAGTTQLVINDAFIVEATCMVDVAPQVEKSGTWSASYVDGSVTITSDTAEVANVAVRVEVRKSAV